MTEPRAEELAGGHRLRRRRSERHLEGIDGRLVRDHHADDVALRFGGSLPEDGDGSLNALAELVNGFDGSVPIGGCPVLPFRQRRHDARGARGGLVRDRARSERRRLGLHAARKRSSERVALGWLKELFGLPASMGGRADHRRDHGELHRPRVCPALGRPSRRTPVPRRRDGLAFPAAWIPVFASGYLHPSDVKALSMLGMGRKERSVGSLGTGRGGWTWGRSRRRSASPGAAAPVDRRRQRGRGERGGFRPDRGDEGAGARARRLVPRGRRVRTVRGGVAPHLNTWSRVSREADSVVADGHKWLNVPYESGFVFVKGRGVAPRRLSPRRRPTSRRPGRPAALRWGYLGPEMSRRARALPNLGHAPRVRPSGVPRASWNGTSTWRSTWPNGVDAAPDLERLADVPLDIVCFRYHPPRDG